MLTVNFDAACSIHAGFEAIDMLGALAVDPRAPGQDGVPMRRAAWLREENGTGGQEREQLATR